MKRLAVLTLFIVLPSLLGTSLAVGGQPAALIDINTATVDELTALPRIGPAIAKRIVAYREDNAPFENIEELMNVKGIGQKTFDRLKDLITASNPKADKEE